MELDMQNPADVDKAVNSTLSYAFNTVTYRNGGMAGFNSTLAGLNLLATVTPQVHNQIPAVASFMFAVLGAVTAHGFAKDYLKEKRERRQENKGPAM